MSAPDSTPAAEGTAPALSDLGYANGWRVVPAIVLVQVSLLTIDTRRGCLIRIPHVEQAAH